MIDVRWNAAGNVILQLISLSLLGKNCLFFKIGVYLQLLEAQEAIHKF
jgi:hypothetical protein